MEILENYLSEFQMKSMEEPLEESVEKSLDDVCRGFLVGIFGDNPSGIFEGIPGEGILERIPKRTLDRVTGRYTGGFPNY